MIGSYPNANPTIFQDTNMLVKAPTPPPVQMAAVVPKYSPLLFTLLFLLLIDFIINAFSEFFIYSSIAMLIVYIVQDVCIAFNALILLIMLINTYMFQAGLIGFMIGKFKSVWFVTILYIGLCIGLQTWLLVTN